ncbi:MAG: hypothetical protein HS120_05015 [Burkholderiales bacterium]|nr:hypothetical protein [Burkholderiales bacterium]
MTALAGLLHAWRHSQRRGDFLLRYIPHDHREAPRLAWQSSSKAAKALGCFVSYTSSQR